MEISWKNIRPTKDWLWKILTYSSTYEQESSRWVILDYMPSVSLLLFVQFLPSTRKHGFISWSNYIVECYSLNGRFKFRYKYLSLFERSFYAISLLKRITFVPVSWLSKMMYSEKTNVYNLYGKILAFPYPKDNHLLSVCFDIEGRDSSSANGDFSNL